VCTGWRRLIGSPKLQIIFHKRATKYRSLLQKMTHKDKGSYESSPPCTSKIPCSESSLRLGVVFLLKTDSGNPRDAGVFLHSRWKTLCSGYCAMSQGSLDWFKVNLSAHPAFSFRLNCVSLPPRLPGCRHNRLICLQRYLGVDRLYGGYMASDALTHEAMS